MWEPVPIVGPALRPPPNEGENLQADRGAPAVALCEVEPVLEPGEFKPELGEAPPAVELGEHEPTAVEVGEPPAVELGEEPMHVPPAAELGEHEPPAVELGEPPGAAGPHHRLRCPL
ncbi:hypothetical protein ACA910_012723 [Epithemia clementina (nom. ined.)]